MMSKRIFIFEFVSGGGFNNVEIPISLFCEGYGMLRSIILDFKTLNFEIATMLDYRIEYLAQFLPLDELIIVEKKINFLKHFKNLIKTCSYIFIIAPESGKRLYNLTKIAKLANKKLLSTNLQGIKLGMSKWRTYEFFRRNKISTPKTYLIPFRKTELDTNFIQQEFNKLKKPVIIKPEDGVGAESIYYIESQEQLSRYFLKFLQKDKTRRKYIIQEFIPGIDLSMSLIGIPHINDSQYKAPILLSVNSQEINIKNAEFISEYFGGTTPVVDYSNLEKKINEIFENIDFSTILGYFGIDFIRTLDARLFFIEINPRLTTSYIGLRNVININPAQLIIDSRTNNFDGYEIKCLNHSLFSRVEMEYCGDTKIEDLKRMLLSDLIKKIPEFVTPPISLTDSQYFTSFIATKSKNLSESKERLLEIKCELKKFDFEIK
ncbi:MAG: ATP-grasp domain-containing protein [Candidatus Thorarchaeota archaeon]